ncbi:MAG: UDP-glucose/GDP-mannose dehydrogenase family protein, partial [Magnetococcales bacterium]|nr:UDP-glucose/GDP-mannose dehydrogenase family protein [Magnetococcales bacterium]
ATKIMFINQIANLCESVGADVHHVAKGMGLDRRIGGKFLHPGPGYGGSCFPKDTQALVRTAEEHHEPMTIVEAVVAANLRQKRRMVDKIVQAAGGSLVGVTAGVLGLTFKPNTDDMRDSPSLLILPELVRLGARVVAYDPEIRGVASDHFPEGVTFATDAYAACREVDLVLILTEWNQFRNLDLTMIRSGMRTRPDGRYLFCDFRNIYEPAAMQRAGFHYVCVGR